MKTHPAAQLIRVWSAVFALAWAALATAGAATATPDAPVAPPEVSLSLRGISDGAVEVGEPFRVAVRVDAPDDATKVDLAPAKGSWIDATAVELISANGKVIPAVHRSATATKLESAVTLDADHPATGLWWFSAESLSDVAPGDYSVRARLTIRDGTGWKGEAVSEPAALRVVPPSADPDRVIQRKLNHARAAISAGDPAKGGAILYGLLEQDPNLVPALVLQAALSLQGGNRNLAHVYLDRALMISSQPGEEPSAELHELAVRIERSRTERQSPMVMTEVRAVTPVPRGVFEPVRTEGSTNPGLSASDAANPTPAPAPVLAPKITTPIPASAKPAVAPAPVATAPSPPVVPAASAASIAPAIPAASSLPANSAGGPGEIIKSTELSDAIVLAHPAGQWAASATAGSQYDRNQYSAAQATGAPNVPIAGNSPAAWCPAVRDRGMDWLELTFAKPVSATGLRVRQNDASGAIAKVEAIEPDGTVHVWWEGVDPNVPPAVREIVWFGVRLPQTSYLVARVKLTLNLASGPGYKEIDAVQLVAAGEP